MDVLSRIASTASRRASGLDLSPHDHLERIDVQVDLSQQLLQAAIL
jgi:hypothetical protein